MKNSTILTFIILIIFSSNIYGQVDITSWSSFQLNYKAGDKTVLTFKPILRNKDDLSEHDNSSLDFILNHKINSSWSATLLNRHFFIPNGGDRQFWFMDINYKFPITEKITFANKLRYHLAVNWNRNDVDFIRYHPNISFKNKSKITPFVGMELFYRITDSRSLSGTRYEVGFNSLLWDKIKFTLKYWRQTKFNDDHPLPESHVFLINLGFNLN